MPSESLFLLAMLNPFLPGDKKVYCRTVTESDIAAFESGTVHRVYSTFALARDAEWACRLFVLEMKETDEEGIGTFVSVEHLAPALIGETVEFEAILESVRGNEVICTYTARTRDKLIARGRQIQKVLKKEKLQRLLEKGTHE
ncbi:MAG: hypothetical protein KatS3mg031_1965 [Chitinophagales bacterium]|nr:MAG: hypothetical protein KatS3mg031_1965 [Chitinophagales bacterium]